MPFDHLSNRTHALPFLADRLREGTLVLVLGAGVSKGLGLPNWSELVVRLHQRTGLTPPMKVESLSAEDLHALIDTVRRQGCGGDRNILAEHVRLALYEGVSLADGLIGNELLIALGALMMGSRRGSIRRVVTFNLDSVLEWYLGLHGFVANTVAHPPELEGAEDVRIYHPHGFLQPADDIRNPEKEFFFLGLEDADKRVGTSDPWFELEKHLIRTGIWLFVGVSLRSFRDRLLGPLFASVGGAWVPARPTGLWLVSGDHPIRRERLGELRSRNIVPIEFDKHDEVPPFLLSVCETAAINAAKAP